MSLSLTQVSCNTVAEAVSLSLTNFVTGTLLYIGGGSSTNDGKQGCYLFDSTSMATDDGYSILRQSVVGTGDPGRWFRIPENADWTESDNTNVGFIKNKPTLSTVATSGAYSDLSGKPSIPAAQVNTDWNSVSGVSQLLNKPSFATVATSGAYSDLTGKPTIPSTTRTTSTLSLSLVGTGATGTQISSTLPSTVRVTVSTSTTSTIGGPATSLVTLKKCATNSSTEGDWTSVAVVESDQTITLAVVLQSLQVVKGQMSCDLDAGWYVKLVNSGTGTHTEQFVSGEKTIYG